MKSTLKTVFIALSANSAYSQGYGSAAYAAPYQAQNSYTTPNNYGSYADKGALISGNSCYSSSDCYNGQCCSKWGYCGTGINS
jgi:hypothetical protein